MDETEDRNAQGGEAGAEAARVAYDDLASLDLDNYEGMGVEEIGAALGDLARRATPSQLEAILDGPLSTGDAGEGDKDALVARYVSWRLETIERLRNLRRTLVIDGLD